MVPRNGPTNYTNGATDSEAGESRKRELAHMMERLDRAESRREAREYWDRHDITDNSEHDVMEEIEVRKPLSAMISVRLSQEGMRKLKALAQTRRMGVTTTARKLLEEGLERPFSPQLVQALEDPGIQAALDQMFNDAKIPPGDGEAAYYVLSKVAMETLARQVHRAFLRLVTGSLSEATVVVTPEDGEAYEGIKILEATRS